MGLQYLNISLRYIFTYVQMDTEADAALRAGRGEVRSGCVKGERAGMSPQPPKRSEPLYGPGQ